MNDVILESRTMEGLSPEAQAKKAIRHALETIRRNPNLAWHMGVGTESWSLLSEALASLSQAEDLAGFRMALLPDFEGTSEARILEAIRRKMDRYEGEGPTQFIESLRRILRGEL